MLLTIGTPVQAQQALYACAVPGQPFMSASSEEERNALTPQCRRWIELRSTTQLTMVLNELGDERFKAANFFLAQATQFAGYDYPTADTWPVTTAALYSNPERYGFVVSDPDEAPTGTIVTYDGHGGILVKARGSPDEPWVNQVLYPSAARNYELVIRPPAIPGEQPPKALVPFPTFPWPPPQPSATEVLPRDLLNVGVSSAQLKDIDAKFTDALDLTGYYENSYFAVPGGFALVTRLEQIESDGTPKAEPERWSIEVAPGSFSLAKYFRQLIVGTPGYYRVIVFVVTRYSFSQSNAQVTRKEATSWLNEGLNSLPTELALLYYTDDYDTTALIYEFARPTENDQANLTDPSTLLGRVHIERSGIWSALQQ